MRREITVKKALLVALLGSSLLPIIPFAHAAKVELRRDDGGGCLRILIDGKEALVYQYGSKCDMPHFFPVLSPSGKQLTIQRSDPYPHHRSFWFGDTVQLEGQPKQVSFYAPLYSQVDKNDPDSPYRDRIRHVKFLSTEVAASAATLQAQLIWESELGQVPVMDEVRTTRIVPLDGGEYFLDCDFAVTAGYGDVTFKSDPTHYAWPYVRMHPQFAAERIKAPLGAAAKAKAGKIKTPPPAPEPGTGVITNSEGGVGEKETGMKPARWVDYSGTVDGVTEGLAIFADPKQPPVKFFTRGYGTFGPRRPDELSGKTFVLKKGQTLTQHVGVLVHSGDVKAGRVAERYQQFAEGTLK